jgi:hypothetical protein
MGGGGRCRVLPKSYEDIVQIIDRTESIQAQWVAARTLTAN